MTEFSDTDMENRKTALGIFRQKLGDECMRKMQTMLNAGMPVEHFVADLRARFAGAPDDAPDDAIHLWRCCLEYLRRHKPLRPWPGPWDGDRN